MGGGGAEVRGVTGRPPGLGREIADIKVSETWVAGQRKFGYATAEVVCVLLAARAPDVKPAPRAE